MNAPSTNAKIHVPGLTLPCKFGPYLLFDTIGRGGMAELYLGRETNELGVGRLSVVKQILFEYASNPAFTEMLTYEAKLASRLNHGNIVHVYDLGRIDDQLFIAMEYVEGFDLAAVLRRCSKQGIGLPLEFVLFVVEGVLRALSYAHKLTAEDGGLLRIVHRDVSPSNILLSLEGDVKLCDFGIAHANDRVLREGGDDAIQGKASYMSPEQALGEPVDARSDLFSLGVIFWELLSGRKLYASDPAAPGEANKALARTRESILSMAKAAVIPAIPERGFEREQDLHAIVMKALAKRPEARFSSADEMLRALDEYVSHSKRFVSQIRLADWLQTHFGEELISRRRMRERAAKALERGPLVELRPIVVEETHSMSAPEHRESPSESAPRDEDGARGQEVVVESKINAARSGDRAVQGQRSGTQVFIGVLAAIALMASALWALGHFGKP